MKKRLVSFLLAISMVLTFLPVSAVTAFAAEGETVVASGNCGIDGEDDNSVTWKLTQNGEDYTLTISGNGEMTNDTPPWLDEYAGSITKVVLEDGVTSIGYYAFGECYSLTKVTIPESVTSIGDSAFIECSELAEVTIPENVTSIGEGAFSDCSGLTKVEIPANVTSIGPGAFYDCSGIASFEVAEANKTFSSDSNGILYEDTAEGKVLRFYPSAKTDTEITISDDVTSIGENAFNWCANLESVTIQQNSVTSISAYAFAYNAKLKNITIPDDVTSIGKYAFAGCESLNNVTIPDSVTSIADSTFTACKGLTSITIPKSVTSIGETAFYGCGSLASVEIPGSVTSIGDFAFSMCKKLTSITIPDSVTSIAIGTFSNCSVLTSVTIPESVRSIGNSAFNNCSRLTNIYYTGDLAGWNKLMKNTNDSKIKRLTPVCSRCSVTFKDGGNTIKTESVQSGQKVSVPQDLSKDGYTFVGWSTDGTDAELFQFDTPITKDTTLYAVWQKIPATLTTSTDKLTCTVGETAVVGFTIAPNGDKNASAKVSLSFDGEDAVESLTLTVNDQPVSSEGLSFEHSFDSLVGMTGNAEVVFKKAGTYTMTATLTVGDSEPIVKTVEITVKEKPVEPVETYDLTVKGGTVKVDGNSKAADENGVIVVEKDAEVEVTFDKSTLSDAQVFDQWFIKPDSVLNAVNPKSETIRFTMPAEKVTIEAMTRDATIEDDGPDILGTAAIIGTAAVGTVVLAYQGYQLGTEFYLKAVLPAGAAIPQNYGELAKLIWMEAGEPAPAAVLAADATDVQKALAWAVESQLISADQAADTSVTRWDVIRTWKQAQEMKKSL